MRLLEIKDLSIKTKTSTLVDGVSFHLDRSEIVSIVGESGSGKSLTCLSLLNLLPKSLNAEGSVIFNDDGSEIQLLNMDAKLRSKFALKKIAFIFQEPLSALNPVQTCGKQILENIKLCGTKGDAAEARAHELLKMVELNNFDKVMNAYPFELSGGQRQRVMIAMALAGDPDLIVADEPTTALDVLLQDEILGLIKRISKEEGKSVLFVSHDLDAVRKFSDRIIVMYKGKVIESGNADEIIANPRADYTKALLACKPNPDKKGYRLATIDQLEQRAFEMEDRTDPEKLLVKVHLLHKEYRKDGKVFNALKAVSFDIRSGQSVGLIGESGSGKSTISKILVQLEEKSGGSIDYYFDADAPLSSSMQMIFQDPFSALNPLINVKQMLREVIEKHQSGLNRETVEIEIDSLLTKVGLKPEDKLRYPSDFSGGQRQRLCIARALAVKPKMLICDESTSALDLSVQAQILNLLKELQLNEGLGVLMITHSMAVAAWFCSYLIVLKDGYVVEQGPTRKLINAPSSAYTKAMVAHI